MVADVLALTRAYLIGQPDLTAKLGAMNGAPNVWAKADPPPGYNPATYGAGVVFQVRGGTDTYSTCILRPSIQYRIYGETEAQAQAAYLALYDALRNAKSDTYQLLSTRLEAQGQLTRDPATNWPMIFTAWTHFVR